MVDRARDVPISPRAARARKTPDPPQPSAVTIKAEQRRDQRVCQQSATHAHALFEHRGLALANLAYGYLRQLTRSPNVG